MGDLGIGIGCVFVLLFILFVVLISSIKVVSEYERGVIFRLGRLVGARGPGIFLVIPILERMVRVDLRVIPADVPSQEVITLDNVTIKVNAVLYFQVLDPNLAVNKVTNYILATMQIAQTTLRSVVGQFELDALLAQRDIINQNLQRIIDEQTEPWGIKVTIVEVKDVELPSTMQRAMAKQAEAEREKRAKIIHAEGEFQASKQLSEAAKIISSEPATLQLRYLQTLSEISVEKNSTIVFPLPVDTIKTLMDSLNPTQAIGSTDTQSGGSEHKPNTFGLQASQSAETTTPGDLQVCSACGGKAAADATFCPGCGQRLDG